MPVPHDADQASLTLSAPHLLYLFLKKLIGKYVVSAITIIPECGGKFAKGEVVIAATRTVINAFVEDVPNMNSNSSLFSNVCPGCLFSDFASAASSK